MLNIQTANSAILLFSFSPLLFKRNKHKIPEMNQHHFEWKSLLKKLTYLPPHLQVHSTHEHKHKAESMQRNPAPLGLPAMAWRLHCMHEWICGEFLVLFFIHLFFIHLITDHCFFWGHASSKIKHIWLAVRKWAVWWNYGVCTEQGTVHGIENKAQPFFAR